MAADIYTKAFSDPLRLEHALLLIGVLEDKKVGKTIKQFQQILDASASRFKKKPKPEKTEEAAPAEAGGRHYEG